jgi:DNA-binding protein H-NS
LFTLLFKPLPCDFGVLAFVADRYNKPDVIFRESDMPKAAVDLGSMTVEALLRLRDDIGSMLSQKGQELKLQLQRLEGGVFSRGRGAAARSHPRKGVKVAPKYRGPNGETWAGRGATPKWLTALTKEGHKPEEFLIVKGAASAKRAAVKRGGRRRKA